MLLSAFVLVGISICTFKAIESYKLAQEFRKRGKVVVVGGPHPTLIPEEAINYADSVVIGEAEGSWQKLLEDFKKKKLKPFYENKNLPHLINLPHPKWELLPKNNKVIVDMIQVTRGCPFSCDFCYHSAFPSIFRLRPIKDIVKEMISIKSHYIYFADDNLTANKIYAKNLFKKLSGLNKRWISNVSIEIAEDNELLSLLYKSGCRLVTVGLESVSQKNLDLVNKRRVPVEKYLEYIKRFHAHGIMISAFLIFGFENDDPSIFERTLEFVERSKVDSVRSYILTPILKTPLYFRLKSENRLIKKYWEISDRNKFPLSYNVADGNTVVFIPKKMSVEQLQDGFCWFQKEINSISRILKRIFTSSTYSNFLISFGVNQFFRKNLGRLK